jgi:AraC-like DNA-binding protein
MSQGAVSFAPVHKGSRHYRPQLTHRIDTHRTTMDDTQALLRQWIETILAEKQWSKARLAKEAGFPTSTITRLFHDDYKGSMNMGSIAKIVRATGKAAPRNIGGVEQADGMAEPEATPYMGIPISDAMPPAHTIWTAKSASLQAMGLMPGDHFILDQAEAPRLRDMIVVQKYDHQTATAETLLRLYVDGFAVTPMHLIDNEPRIWLDGTNALCMGVIVKSWRTRI